VAGFTGAWQLKKDILKNPEMMDFLLSEDKATLEGGEMVEENSLQASLFGRGSSSVGGKDNAVNESMELADQDDVDIPVPNIPPLCQCLSIQTQLIQVMRVLKR
jgi:hypothetical protein